jgi:hypothetical protein
MNGINDIKSQLITSDLDIMSSGIANSRFIKPSIFINSYIKNNFNKLAMEFISKRFMSDKFNCQAVKSDFNPMSKLNVNITC